MAKFTLKKIEKMANGLTANSFKDDACAAEMARCDSIWKFGRALENVTEEKPSRIKDMARKLGVSAELIRSARRFYKGYPSKMSPASKGLTWEHFLVLLNIRKKDERAFYEHEAIRHAWSVDDLKKGVQDGHFHVAQKGVGISSFLSDSGRRGRAVGGIHNRVQVASQTNSEE